MFGWKILYSAGRQFEKLQQWGAAEFLYKGMLATTEKSNAIVNYRLGNLYFLQKEYEVAASYIETSLQLDPSRSSWYYRLGFIHERLKQYGNAERFYAKSIQIDPLNSGCLYRLAKTQLALKNQVGAVESLKMAADLDPDNRQLIDMLYSAMKIGTANWEILSYFLSRNDIPRQDKYWQYRIARLYDEMHQLEDAANFYRIANKKHDDAWWQFHEGDCLQRLGHNDQAKARFERAIALDSKYSSQQFGIGAFYQKLGDWPSAQVAYFTKITETGATSALLYRLGLSHDRMYQWDSAIENYREAIELDSENANIYYRLSYCFEQKHQYAEAIKAINGAISVSNKAPNHYYYRLAFCLEKDRQYYLAAQTYLRNGPDFRNIYAPSENLSAREIIVDSVEAHESTGQIGWTSFRDSARKAAMKNDWVRASELMAGAIDRCPNFDASLYYEVGYYNVEAGYADTACKYLRETQIYQSARQMDHAKDLKMTQANAAKAYSAYRESLEIRKDYVLYESHLGASIDCNPLAIFNELLANPSYAHLQHIWVVSGELVVPPEVRENDNVLVIHKNSDLYRRYLATAEYLISNVTFQNYFIRRSGQKYLNTWHGTPIKTLGKDINTGFLQHSNVARNLLQASHILTANRHTADILTKRHDIDHVMTAKIGFTGYPRTDLTINASYELKMSIKESIGIPADSKLPVVLYAPTWRGDTTNQYFDTEKLRSDIASLNKLECHFVFRGHPLMEEAIRDLDVDFLSAPRNIDSNSLLSVIDVLITDYSSIIFDFLSTKRPICLYAHDETEYKTDRGLYLELRELPALVSTTIEELCADVKASLDGLTVSDEVYSAAIATYAPMDDGHAAGRAIEFFFDGDDNHVIEMQAESRISLLFRASLIPNGVTSSFLNLVSQLDPEKYVVSIILEPSAFLTDLDRLEKVYELPKHIRILGRAGGKVFSPDELWVDSVLNRTGTLNSSAQWETYLEAYTREFERVFGKASFDALIEFDGYSLFWGSLMAAGRTNGSKSLIYQHSDMKREWSTRSGYLTPIFNLYRHFDGLVSVSETIADINCGSLSEKYEIPARKFVGCNNQLDISKILNQSQQPLDEDISDWLVGAGFVFCTIGRLSVEKNQRKLIEAFAQYLPHQPDSKLVIVGDGPLREELDALVFSLGISDSVLIAGSRRNPFPTLMRSDLFLLSSDHEGQPMVLLEALVLGKSIVSVDIPGARSILQNSYGELVSNSIAGLSSAMRRFGKNATESRAFDATGYQSQALDSFERLLVQENRLESPLFIG